MVISKAKLSKRLGVGRSAISNAISRGDLVELTTGQIDTDEPTNRAYLARFSGHRGKTTERSAPASPERAAALLARAKASYHRSLQKFDTRRESLVPRENIDAAITAALSTLRAEFAQVSDRVNLGAQPLEIELERVSAEALELAKAAMRKAFLETEEDAREAADLPEEIPEGSTLDQVRALIDQLAAESMDVDRDTAAGFNMSREAAARRVSALNEKAFRLVLSWPRRTVARIAAALETEGEPAARRLVASLSQDEITRLKGVTV